MENPSAGSRRTTWSSVGGGQLGVGHTNNLGDDPGDFLSPAVSLGGTPVQIASNYGSTCAILRDGKVKCWGYNGSGQLGYANTVTLGDNPGEMPPPAVSLGGNALTLSIGSNAHHHCALDTAYNLRCWGDNFYGQLGYGHMNDIGDNEHPVSAGPVPN